MIAVFDFDQTLVREHSLRKLYRQLSRPIPLWLRSLPVVLSPALFGGDLKNVLKRRLYRRLFAGRTEQEIRDAAARAAASLHPNAPIVAALHLRRHSLDVVVVASASPRIAVEAMLQALRIPVHHLVATELAVRDGRLTGELDGPECLGEEKARRLRLALEQWQLSGELAGYGNLPEDGPMLALCAQRHVVARGRRVASE